MTNCLCCAVPVRSNELKIPQGMFRRKKDDDVALSGLFGGKSKGKKGKKGKKGASTQKVYCVWTGQSFYIQ